MQISILFVCVFDEKKKPSRQNLNLKKKLIVKIQVFKKNCFECYLEIKRNLKKKYCKIKKSKITQTDEEKN